jgi:hypothetical protein
VGIGVGTLLNFGALFTGIGIGLMIPAFTPVPPPPPPPLPTGNELIIGPAPPIGGVGCLDGTTLVDLLVLGILNTPGAELPPAILLLPRSINNASERRDAELGGASWVVAGAPPGRSRAGTADTGSRCVSGTLAVRAFSDVFRRGASVMSVSCVANG